MLKGMTEFPGIAVRRMDADDTPEDRWRAGDRVREWIDWYREVYGSPPAALYVSTEIMRELRMQVEWWYGGRGESFRRTGMVTYMGVPLWERPELDGIVPRELLREESDA